MKDPKDLPPDFTDLRQRAEAQLEAEAIPPEELSPDQAARLIHKLRVHQIELEMQNDELRRSQAELEESRSKYADLYDFAPVGYLTLDPRGSIVEANLTAATLLGVERSKLLGRFFHHFLVDDDRQVFRQVMNNDLDVDERQGEFHLQDGGGNPRVMQLNILFLTDAAGQDRRRVSLTDITELKQVQEELRLHKEDLEELVAHRTSQLIEVNEQLHQANEQLRQANEQLEALFAAAPLAIAALDTEGRVIRINLAAELLYGWTQEEFQGRLPLTIPQDSPEESLALLQRLLGGESITGVEIKQQCKDGTILDISVSGAPLFDARGKIRGFIGLAEDITARKQQEETLRTQALVLANMAEGVTVTDQSGQIVYTNPAFDAMFGYEPGELLGRHSNVLNFYPPEENVAVVKEILAQVNATGLWTGEFRNCRKNGQPFFTSARISSLLIGGKKLYISVQEDITQRKRAQEMLQRQAELLDLAHDAIFVRDLVGRITYWNQAATELYGWTKAEAMGQVVHRLLATQFSQSLESLETQVLEQGSWEGELIHTTRDGRSLTMDSRWTLKRDDAGRPLAILEINRDITARRQAEAALRKSEARLRRLVESNVVGLVVSDEEKIVEANDEFLRLVGHTREEMLAGAVKWVDMTPREYIPQDAQALYELRTIGAHTPYEKTFVRQDGSQVPVVVGGALLEEEPFSWVSFVLDISERKKLEESLRVSEARFRAIFANASIGIATTDLMGRLQQFNASVINGLGYTPTELKGMSFLDVTHPDDLAVDKDLFTELAAGRRDQYQVEKRCVRKDGAVLWGRLHVSLVRGAGGEPEFTVALVEDITARKEAQAALEESEARYRSLVDLSPDAIVVHAGGRYLFANPAGLRLFGAAHPGELIGRRVLELVHPDSIETVRRRVETGERLDLREVKILRLDGQPVEVEVAATPIQFRGRPAVQVVIRDITERQQAEREIRRMASFPELNPNPVLEVDEDGEVTYANPAAREIVKNLGITAGVQAFVPSTLKEIFAAAREGGPRQYSFDLSLKGASYAVTLHLPHDLPLARLYALDITKRKAAEVALQESEGRERARAGELQAILDTTPGVIFLAHDPESRVITGNRAAYEILRRTPGSNLSKSAGEGERPENFRIMKGGREVSVAKLPVQRAAAGETVRNYELDLVFDDGTVRHVLGDAVPVLDEAGQPRGSVAAFLDITERKRAEEALARSQAQFAAIFNSLSDGVVFADPERRIVMINPAAETLFGYSQKEMQGRSTEFLYASLEDYEEQGRRRYHTNPELSEAVYEITYRRKDGSSFPAEARGGQVKDAQGRVLGLVSINRDITQRKAAEEALRESRGDLNRAQAVAHTGSWRLNVHKNELTWSEENHRIFGISPGTPMTYETFLGLVHPEDREYVNREWTAALKGEPYDIEHRILVDGVVKWVRERAELEFDSRGNLLGGFGTTQDITERKRAEEALIQAKEEWERTFDAVPDFIAILDREHRITRMNKAMSGLLGKPPEEVIGQPCYREVHGLDQAPPYCPHSLAVDLGEVTSAEVQEFGRIFAVTVSPILVGGQLAGSVHVARDITEKRRSEEALRESEERYRSLFENNHAVMLLIDPETGSIVDANPAAATFYGYTLEDLLARRITDINTLNPEQVINEMQQAQTESRRHFEFKHRLSTGEVRDVEVFSGPIRLAGRELLYSIVHDITARKEAEGALRESEARFRSLFENMTEGVALHEIIYDDQGVPRDYRILATNPAFTVHTGLDPEKVQGRLASEAFGTGEAPYLETYARVAHIGQPETFETYFAPLERHFAISATSPKPGHFVTVFEDITARKLMEVALLRSNQRLDLLAESAGRLFAAASPQQVIDSLCQKVMEFLDCDVFFNYLADASRENLQLNAWAGIPAAEARRIQNLDYGVAVCGCAAREARRIVCEDILNTDDPRTELVKSYSVQAYACHPLTVGGRVLGTLSFGSRRRTSFTADDLALMNAVADQVAIALDRQQAEAALKQSEARYRAIGELIPFGIWTADPTGGWQYVSKSFLKMTGKTMEECQGLKWAHLLPQEDIKPTMKAWQHCRQTGGFWDYEYKIRGRDGGWRTVLSRGLPLADSQGDVTSWVGINLDISERKEMEEDLRRAKDELEARVEERTAALRLANQQLLLEIEERQQVEDRLRESEARFTSFMEHLPGLAVMRDMEGHYLFANLTWEETMGLEPGAWRGKTLAQLWPPDRANELQKLDFQIISSEEPIEQVEVQVLADGPHHFLTSRFPIRDAYGLPYMVGAIAVDITARRRAEQQVAETARLYRVLSQVNEAILKGRDQKTLFEQVCRIVVEEGLFSLAWVGSADTESQAVRVAAKYGFDEGYLDDLNISLADDPHGRGPTGTAIREDRYVVCNEFSADPRMAPWRDKALARGYRASGAFPLRIGDKVVGVLTMYAPIPGFFTDKEISLLTTLADNLSFALDFLDREAKRRRAEEALAMERQRFFDLLERLPAFVYLQAPDYTLRFANREFRQRFGDPHGGTCYSLIWGHDAPCPDCPTFTVFHTGQPREWEYTAPDGRVYQVYDYPFADVDGSPLVLEMGIDITDRKQAEEALAEQVALVQDLYNNAPCGYHSLDSEGYIAQINDTELAWLGYTRDEVVGRLHFTDLLAPDSRKLFEKTFPRFKKRGWVKDIEYELVRKDGTVFPVNLSATAVTDEAGNYLMSRSSLFDITDRKHAEVALKQSEAMLRQILETLPVGVWVTDRDGRIIQGNPAAQHIWEGARYAGMEEYGEYQGWWADTGKKIEPDEWALARAIQKGETSLGEVINIQCFDGSRKTIINSGVPLFSENREILGAIAVNQDITEMLRAEQVIREQARQLEAFFAHSLTPLVFLDRDFNFLRVNEAYARAFQREAQAFIGHNHFEFYPHPENQAIFAEVVRSKTSYQVQAKAFEFPDHPEWGVTYWDWSLTPILDQAGEVDFLVFSLRDVTRRVLSEQARNRLIEILEATPDFVGIADFYGRLQYLNRAGRNLVGLGEDEDITRLRVLDLHPEWVGRLILENGTPTALREGAWQAELALLHRDGREIPVSQVILAHKDPAGRVQFFSTVARDISDMKEAQANILRQAAILDGINRIFRETLTCETARELAQSCLSIAEALTKSQFGFITKLNQQDRLDALALSEPDWQSCGMHPPRDLSHIKDLEPKGLLARPIREGQAVIANAPASQPDWTGTLTSHSPMTAYLGMPLTYGGKTMGLLGLGNKKGGYTLTDQEAVESLAPAIVEALMHHRAEEALKSSERKLRYLADELLTAQENERKRLAAELHDELGHALLALKLHLSSIEKKLPPEHTEIKKEIRSQLDYIHEVIQDVRRLYHDLSPGDVEDLGLTKALRTLINDFAGHLPQITWQVDLADLEGLFSLPVQTTIYRIMQEGLTNIGKHANPTAVTITATKENHQVHFVVQDNGAGFNVAKEMGSRSHGRGVGLVAMEERLNMVGGSFEIHSRVQEGTRLSFTIPVIPEGEKP